MNPIIPYLQSASALSNYRLMLKFEDGVEGIIELSKWRGKGIFEYWNNEENFKMFRIDENKKIEWNENIDMDPDAFYLQLINKTFEEYAGDKQLLWYSH